MTPPSDSPWLIPGLTQRLLALHAEGMIMRDIADRLSFEFETDLTRNAVIGKCRRLAMPEREPRVRERKPSRIRIDAPIAPVEAPQPRNENLTIYQLENGVCHWPLGAMQDHPPFMFCGKDAVEFDAPYCPAHSAIAYHPARKAWE